MTTNESVGCEEAAALLQADNGAPNSFSKVESSHSTEGGNFRCLCPICNSFGHDSHLMDYKQGDKPRASVVGSDFSLPQQISALSTLLRVRSTSV